VIVVGISTVVHVMLRERKGISKFLEASIPTDRNFDNRFQFNVTVGF
jgi:hypothetical protein